MGRVTMPGYRKMIKRAVALALLVMLFLGAISFQIVAERAIAAYNEQKAWQDILDTNLQPYGPKYEEGDNQNSPTPPYGSAGNADPDNEEVSISGEEALLAEM